MGPQVSRPERPAARELHGVEAESCPSCGHRHLRPVCEVWLEKGALERLDQLAERARWRRIVLVADANTAEVLGDRIAADLSAAGHVIWRVTFPRRRGLLADEAAVVAVRRALGRGGDSTPADAAVAVGSGTLTDITRYASFLEHRPWCAVPTAASMDGYASSVAAMQFGGLKVSFPAQAPVGIFAEPAVIAAAPGEMAVWGLGDLLGKASASFDWRLGQGVTGEPYCAEIEGRLLEPLRRCCDRVESILAGEEAGVEALFAGLVESGLAMALQGSSRPASGSEHHCSHFWDLLAFEGLREYAPHGLQVGYATGFTTQLQRACLEDLARPFVLAPGGPDEGEARWLARGSPELAAVRDAKIAEFEHYSASWPAPAERLETLRTALGEAAALSALVAEALRRARHSRGPRRGLAGRQVPRRGCRGNAGHAALRQPLTQPVHCARPARSTRRA